MALSIKDEETDRLVRRYAALKGVSYTRAIRLAVSNALDTEAAPTNESLKARAEHIKAKIREIQERVARLPVLDSRSAEEILFDKDGLPK